MTIAHADLAWATGLYEGEGSCSISRGRNGRPYPKTQLAMCDAEPVLRFASVMPFGSSSGPTLSPKARECGLKPRYTWVGTGWDATQWFLDALRPWLSERRVDQMEHVLAHRPPDGVSYGGSSGRRLTAEQVEYIRRSTRSAAELATEVGFSANTVRNVRTGRRRPLVSLPLIDGSGETDTMWVPWAAGLYEAEGSCTETSYKTARFTMSMCDSEPLIRFQEALGIGTISGPHCYGDYSPRWTWQAVRPEATQTARRLLVPWLSQRRCEQIARASALQDNAAGGV